MGKVLPAALPPDGRPQRRDAATAMGSTASPPPSPHPAAHAPDAGVNSSFPSPSLAVTAASPAPAHAHVPAAASPAPAHAPVPAAAQAHYPAASPVQDPAPVRAAPAPVRATLASQDAEGQKKRPAKAPVKNKPRTPMVPVVGSPGVKLILSQASPRSIGVKRSSPTPSHTPGMSRRSKRRKLKSEMWNDFDPLYDGNTNKLMEAKCKHCKRVFPVAREVGTSQCLRHLLVCEERAKINEFLDSMKSTMSQSDPNTQVKWKYDPNRAHFELVRMIVLHELPFRIVEYEGFRQFVHSLNPAFELVSRTTIRIDCVDLFKEHKIKLREALEELNSRVSLTADMWTSRQLVSFMCITCHFIDEEWKLRKRVIWFSEAETPHDGTNLFNIMLECIQDWGLQEKIHSITLDNASNNNLCVTYMKANLLGKDFLLCKGDLLHGRCGAHVINLVVQEGLVVNCMAVDNIRESIKFVRSSTSRKKKFKDIAKQEGIACTRKVSLDVPTRWNSTHLMIKTALEYKRAFGALKLQDTSYTHQPTHDEWKTAESVCNLLEVFLDATMVVSGTLYPTSHLYFHELWKIYLTLQREAEHEDSTIKSMVEVMKEKFMKYWKLSYLNICLPVILDPRYKFKFLELCLKSGLEGEAPKHLNRVKKTFKDLFVEYSSHDVDSKMEENQGTSNTVAASIDNPWDQWKIQVQEEQQQRAKLTELNVYLKDGVHPQEEGFDILVWWSANAQKYPIVSSIAKDVLATPALTVASESVFSTGGRILSDYRSNMKSDTLEALICLQDWMWPRGTTRVKTITNDVVYGTRADMYGTDDDILGP